MTKFEVDQGEAFGTWKDPTSRFMYEDSLRDIVPLAKLQGRICDYGGANGLLRCFAPHLDVTTVDMDASKRPDIVDNILDHRTPYDTGWCRYVLHYLTDQQVLQFLDNVNVKRMVIVQFCNPDLRAKYRNSVGETKYFRTAEQLQALLPSSAKLMYYVPYEVMPEFYLNRLGLAGATAHREELCVFDVAL